MTALSAFATDIFGAGFFRAAPSVVNHNAAESMAFTHALVSLTAKVAAVDGAPNMAEFKAFSALFADADRVSAPRLRSLFMKMVGDASSAAQFARQLVAMTPGDRHLHVELLEKLLAIATADAPLNDAETDLLQSIAAIFGVTGSVFNALVAGVPQRQSSYAVLGITANASADEVRERYLAQVQRLHPDRFQAAGASSDTVAQLSHQLAAVNAAYDDIKRQQANKAAVLAPLTSRWSRKNTKGANAG
jgi:DnaJ like chaperone protein